MNKLQKNRARIVFAVAAGLGLLEVADAAVLYQNDFGTATITGSTYTGTPTLATGISSAVWTNSVGSFTSFGGSSGQALALSNSGGTPTITLTLTLDGNYTLALDSESFWRQRSASGAQAFTLAVNGTQVNSGTVPTTGATTGTLTPSTTSFGGVTGLTTYTFVLGLSGASGTGTFRVDDFTLNGTLTAVASAGRYWVGDDATRGGSGTWVQTGGTAWATTDADAAGGPWNTTTLAANFGGASGSVTVSDTVNANAGINFSGDYTLAGGTAISLGGATTAANQISVATGKSASINTALTGTAGFTKAGAGTLTVGGTNSGLSGTVDVAAGTLVLGSTSALNSATSVGFSTTAGVLQLGGNSVTIGDLNAVNTTSILENANASAATLTVNGVGAFAGILRDGTGGGPLGLSKTGSGSLTVSGSNTFTGGVSVDTGTIVVGSAGAINGLGLNTLTMTNGGKLTLNGNSPTVAGLTGTAGTVIENGHIAAASMLTVNKASGSSTFSGLIQNGAVGTLGLTKAGNGELVLAGANTYTGPTYLTRGTLKVTDGAALGTSAVNITNGNLLASAGVTVANNMTVSLPYLQAAAWDFQTTAGGGTAANAAPNSPTVYTANFGSGTLYIDGTNGSDTWTTATGTTNELTSFGGTALNTAGTSLSTDTSGNSALALVNQSANGKSVVFKLDMTGKAGLVASYATRKTDTGFNSQSWSYSVDGSTWVAADTFTDMTTAFGVETLAADLSALNGISTAYLKLTVTGASAASGNNRLDNFQFNYLDLSATPVIGSDATSGTTTFTGAITLNSLTRLQAAPGGRVEFGGSISGTSGLIKTGGGTVVIGNASNTYAGATSVSAGTLLVNGTLASGGGAVTVNGTGTLGGTGTIARSVVVASGGTLSPGNSIGTMTVSSIDMTGGTYFVELNGDSDIADQLIVSGAATLGGANLTGSVTGTFTEGETFTIVDAANGNLTGAFAQGASVVIGGQMFGITYSGGDGGDVILTAAVPEPSTLGLLSIGALGLMRRRRRTHATV